MTDLPYQVAEHFGAHEQSKYQAVMALPEIDQPTKQLIGLAIAVTKTCAYVSAFQRQQLASLNVPADQITETLAVAAFFDGLDAFAHALHVDSELRPRRLAAGDMSLIDREIDVNVPYVIESDDPVVQTVYGEIKKTMGIPFVPNIFKAMAHQPAALEAKWQSYKAVMLAGDLSRLSKELVAIAVSAVNACYY